MFLFLAFNPDSYRLDLNNQDQGVVFKREREGQMPPKAAVFYDDETVYGNIAHTLGLMKIPAISGGGLTVSGITDGYPSIDTIVMAKSYVSDEETAALRSFMDGGGDVIFAVLPNDMGSGLLDLLGIVRISYSERVVGFDVYKGIFVHEQLYRSERIGFDCARVILKGNCKVFGLGYDPYRDVEEDIEEADPDFNTPILWRTYYGKGALFVINAPFMQERSGMGILTGALTQVKGDFIYPVVDALNIVITSFPIMREQRHLVVGRSDLVFLQDIVWPGLIAISRNYNIPMTVMTNGGFEQSKDAVGIIDYFGSELHKYQGELGYTFEDDHDFAMDEAFLKELLPLFDVRSFIALDGAEYSEFSHKTGTMSPNINDAFTWVNDRALVMPVFEGDISTEQKNFELISLATTMGYVSVAADFRRLFDNEEDWSRKSVTISQNVNYLTGTFGGFGRRTVSQSAEKAKDYLNLDMTVEYLEHGINVAVSGNQNEVSFILRTHKKVDLRGGENCSVRKIGENVYMVTASGDFFIKYN
jgi:hypothetical protein